MTFKAKAGIFISISNSPKETKTHNELQGMPACDLYVQFKLQFNKNIRNNPKKSPQDINLYDINEDINYVLFESRNAHICQYWSVMLVSSSFLFCLWRQDKDSWHVEERAGYAADLSNAGWVEHQISPSKQPKNEQK